MRLKTHGCYFTVALLLISALAFATDYQGTATTTELNRVHGVTSAIQTQFSSLNVNVIKYQANGAAEATGRFSIGAAGLTGTHQNVINTIGGTITNTLGNATYGEVILPTINGYSGTSIFGQMIRPYYGRGSGALPIMAHLYLAQPLAQSTGTGTVQDTAMLYIDNAMNETVIDNNYSIWVGGGLARFDGGIFSSGGNTFNGSFFVGGNMSLNGGGPHTSAGELQITPAGILKLELANTDWNTTTHVGSEVQLYTSLTSGNTGFNIQSLGAGGYLAEPLNLNPYGGGVTISGGTNHIYYCNGGVSINTLCRGNGCACVGGSMVDTGLIIP